MPHTMRADSARCLPEKADVRRARRALLGDALRTALVILRVTRLKDQAVWLGRELQRLDPARGVQVDTRQVWRWYAGLDAAPWELLLLVPDLQFPLAQALLESCERDVLELRVTIGRLDAAVNATAPHRKAA